MIVENIKEAKRVKATFLIIPVIFTLIALTIIFLELKNGYWFVGILAVIMVLIFIAISLMQFRYFYCEISPKILLFRFHGVEPMNSEFKSYKIKPEQFKGYKISKVMFGMVPKITIYVTMRGEIAKYPPISISALTKEQRASLEQGLTLLSKINRANN